MKVSIQDVTEGQFVYELEHPAYLLGFYTTLGELIDYHDDEITDGCTIAVSQLRSGKLYHRDMIKLRPLGEVYRRTDIPLPDDTPERDLQQYGRILDELKARGMYHPPSLPTGDSLE
tara:strand:+ start:384 stop:734 length:351 start_codon:yes stop_codon:yes gene_type:complete